MSPAGKRERDYQLEVERFATARGLLKAGEVVTVRGVIVDNSNMHIVLDRDPSATNIWTKLEPVQIAYWMFIPDRTKKCINLLNNLEEIKKLKAGDKIEVHGLVLIDNVIYTCTSEDYYIRKI